MAERLDAYDFEAALRFQHGHPWDEWLDGNPWRLTRGNDFGATAQNFRAAAAREAGKRGLSIKTRRESDTVVVIQAVERGTALRPWHKVSSK